MGFTYHLSPQFLDSGNTWSCPDSCRRDTRAHLYIHSHEYSVREVETHKNIDLYPAISSLSHDISRDPISITRDSPQDYMIDWGLALMRILSGSSHSIFQHHSHYRHCNATRENTVDIMILICTLVLEARLQINLSRVPYWFVLVEPNMWHIRNSAAVTFPYSGPPGQDMLDYETHSPPF